MVLDIRQSGVLLHPTSLPGPYGIGEIGVQAFRFIDELSAMGQKLWQVLPLGPTGYGESPYQPLSSFAGNTHILCLETLVKQGLLTKKSLDSIVVNDPHNIDYEGVEQGRRAIYRSLCRNFKRRAKKEQWSAYEVFCEEEAAWLDDYALFISIKMAQERRSWVEWPEPLKRRDAKALKKAQKKNSTAIRHEKILQFLFHEQWGALKAYANRRGINIIGDLPIFVAHDSVDVWVNPDLFFLDEDGQPSVLSGVPPDCFSENGQLWGNPLYQWIRHAETGYDWWIHRIQKLQACVDIIRIDHFLGFENFWEIPRGEETAIHGKWVKGPSHSFFNALQKHFGVLPIIAEDLGVITEEVEALRDAFGFPGMRIMHFSFGRDDEDLLYRPNGFPENCVVYTGTHDNDTTQGWYNSEPGKGNTATAEKLEANRDVVRRTLSSDGREIHWDLIKSAMQSSAKTSIIAMQDILGLGSEARMNIPGTLGNNWIWRFSWEQVSETYKSRLLELTINSGR